MTETVNIRPLMVDAQRMHSIMLPCKTILEVDRFDRALENADVFNDFMSMKTKENTLFLFQFLHYFKGEIPGEFAVPCAQIGDFLLLAEARVHFSD